MPQNFGPPEQSDEIRLAVRAWNLLGGMDWSGIPVIAEMLGFDDIEMLVAQLVVIRDHQKASGD